MGTPPKRPRRRRPRTWNLGDLLGLPGMEKQQCSQQSRVHKEAKEEEPPVELYDASRGQRTFRRGWKELKIVGAPLQMFHKLENPTVEELAREMAKDNWPFRISKNFWGYELRLGGFGGGKKRKKNATEAKELTPPAYDSGQSFLSQQPERRTGQEQGSLLLRRRGRR